MWLFCDCDRLFHLFFLTATTVKPTTYPTTTPPQTTTTKPLCISPHGTCSYAYLPCPSNSVHCPHEDKGCYNSPLYKCCCKIPPPSKFSTLKYYFSLMGERKNNSFNGKKLRGHSCAFWGRNNVDLGRK